MAVNNICVVYNMAAKYREPIFRLMDKELDIDWYYGDQIGNIKEMDSSKLKNVTRLKRINLSGPLYVQIGVNKLLNNDQYSKYIILGDLFAISTWMMLLRKKLFFPRKKIYLWSHGWYGREGFIKRWLKKIFFGLADGTFLYGNYAREIAIRQGNNPDKLWVIHNSLDHETHVNLRRSLANSEIYHEHFGNYNPTIIFIGRLTSVKQLDLLIKAIKQLNERDEYYNLVIIGDGQEREKLEKLSRQLDVKTWFYGACYDDVQTAQLIYDADICVSPGNVGLTAMHVMSFGTPVITHSNFVNQMPEFEAIIKNTTGNFFEEGSIDSLATTISQWFKNNKSRLHTREECYRVIDEGWTPKFQIEMLNRVLSI
jgi:glycosyltransferase involved in cell wall biosynthesis